MSIAVLSSKICIILSQMTLMRTYTEISMISQSLELKINVIDNLQWAFQTVGSTSIDLNNCDDELMLQKVSHTTGSYFQLSPGGGLKHGKPPHGSLKHK